MSEQITGYLCVSIVCIGWPALWVWVAVNVTRYGWRGWMRQLVLRAKAFGYQEERPNG